MQSSNGTSTSVVLARDAVPGKLSIGRHFAGFAEIRPGETVVTDDAGDTTTWHDLAHLRSH